MMRYWLVKSEPSAYSIDDLKRDKVTHWDGVRNYQARNYLREMEVGDEVLIYHSVDEPIGVAGTAKVAKKAYPDPSQFDKRSEYYDEKSSNDAPRWFCPDIKFKSKFKRVVALADLKRESGLKGMALFQKGSRLSVQPLAGKEYSAILRLAGE